MLDFFIDRKKLALLAVGTVAVGLALSAFLIFLWLQPAPPVDPSKVTQAVRAFWTEHHPAPTTVTFSQLMAEGYLSSNVLQKFGAAEVTVYLRAGDSSPHVVLMDALMPNGTHQTLLSDGSVQQFSTNRFQATPQAVLPGSAATSAVSSGTATTKPR